MKTRRSNLKDKQSEKKQGNEFNDVQRKSAEDPRLGINPRTNKSAIDTHGVDKPSLMVTK